MCKKKKSISKTIKYLGINLNEPGGSLINNPPVVQETPVQFLDWEDPLEKGWATHSSILGLPLWLGW